MIVKLTGDGAVSLGMIALEGDEIIALWVANLLDDRFLTAHGAGRDETSLDGQEVQKGWDGWDVIGLAVSLQLT